MVTYVMWMILILNQSGLGHIFVGEHVKINSTTIPHTWFDSDNKDYSDSESSCME